MSPPDRAWMPRGKQASKASSRDDSDGWRRDIRAEARQQRHADDEWQRDSSEVGSWQSEDRLWRTLERITGTWRDQKGSKYTIEVWDDDSWTIGLSTTRPSGQVITSEGLIRAEWRGSQGRIVWGRSGARTVYTVGQLNASTLRWISEGPADDYIWERDDADERGGSSKGSRKRGEAAQSSSKGWKSNERERWQSDSGWQDWGDQAWDEWREEPEKAETTVLDMSGWLQDVKPTRSDMDGDWRRRPGDPPPPPKAPVVKAPVVEEPEKPVREAARKADVDPAAKDSRDWADICDSNSETEAPRSGATGSVAGTAWSGSTEEDRAWRQSRRPKWKGRGKGR